MERADVERSEALARAQAEEFTRELWAINAHGCEFRFFVRPDADLDSTFTAWDADELESGFCFFFAGSRDGFSALRRRKRMKIDEAIRRDFFPC